MGLTRNLILIHVLLNNTSGSPVVDRWLRRNISLSATVYVLSCVTVYSCFSFVDVPVNTPGKSGEETTRNWRHMELMYRSTIPEGSIHCMAWSGVNLIAVGVSVERDGFVGENFERARSHQLLVLDPNRPWDYQSITMDNKHRASHLSWSQDGSKLIAIDTEGVLHVWRMKNQSANVWVCQHKQEWTGGGSLVYAGWLECHPAVDITAQGQSKAVDIQVSNPHLRIVLGGEAFVVIGSNGKVSLVLFIHTLTRTIDTTLDVTSTIVAASVIMLSSGVVLCAVACADCSVKIFTFNMALCLGNQLSIHPNFVAQFNPSGSQRGDECISSFHISPQTDGCSVHVVCNGNMVQEWSVRDVTRTGLYQCKREHCYSSPGHISSLAVSALCQRVCATPGISDFMRPCVTTPTVTDILMLGAGEESYLTSEARWPTELLAIGVDGGGVILLNRDTYKLISDGQLRATEESLQPATKRHRSQEAGPVVCLSTNGCCLLASHRNTLQMFCIGEHMVGSNDISRCCSLLGLSASTKRSPWDIAVLCARSAAKDRDPEKVKRVLAQLGAEYAQRSASPDQLFYFSTCVLLHSCLEDGLQASLMYRNMARFHGTVNLFKLALPLHEEEGLTDIITTACAENSSEESLEAMASALKFKTISVPPGTASQLQGHIHWVLEFAIDIISTTAKGDITMVPDVSTLLELRMTLLLVHVLNKCLPVPIVPVSDGVLSLFFRVVTVCLRLPSCPIPEELRSEIVNNIPCNKYPRLLTLTRAAYIQGFLSGLSTTSLPESYTRGVAPPIRPHVLKNYMSTDPYSPLMLVVPKGLTPPWRDCFTDGQRDIIHGGAILKEVVMSAKLKQCSRCRCWTVASESLKTSEVMDARSSANPIQQWRNAWSNSCFCGGLWNIRSTNGT